MISCYPQLATGALAQLPLSRKYIRRSVINRLADGTSVRFADPDASLCSWELRYRGLTDNERESIEKFFREVEGRLRSFLFLDPCGNLLAWSDDYTKDVWHSDPLLRAERDGEMVRITNTAQTFQKLQQTIAIPGWYHYSFSASIRASEQTSVRLSLSTADGSIEATHEVTPAERSVFCSGAIEGEAEEIIAAIEFPAGAVAELRGLQLEPQPAASSLKRTTSQTGVFTSTRFDLDSVRFRADGIDDHSTVVQLVSRTGA